MLISRRSRSSSIATLRWGLLGALALLSLLALAGGGSSAATAPTPRRLVLVGGGDKPKAAIGQLVAWAGGPDARILIVAWGSSVPLESAAAFQDDLRPHHPGRVDVAPFAPLDAAKRAQVLDLLARATGVFFTGGDQARHMDVLADPGLLEAFRERYRAGVPFGGSSAGTAIMSPLMIADDGDPTLIDPAAVVTRPGLGLLEGTIVDQHFVKRQRENRLFALVLAHPGELGLGIDEDTALLIEDGRRGRVVGRSVVMLVDGATTPGALVVRLAREGQVVDVEGRQVQAGDASPAVAR